jgi:hypothetical protein
MAQEKTHRDKRKAAVALPRLVRRFTVEVHGGVTPMQAFYYCMKVAQSGEISGNGEKKQHCYHTEFKDGASVGCAKRGKSEHFIVARTDSPNGLAQAPPL